MERRRITRAARGATARRNRPFRFFGLPRELRDMVYNEVWPHTPYLYRETLLRKASPLIDITTNYRKQTDGWTTDVRYPQWVLVSHAFLSEAMEQYFRNAEWLAKIPGSYFTTRIYLSSSKFSWESDFYLGYEIEDLRVGKKLLTWIPNDDYSRTVLELYKAWPMHMPILKKLEPGLCGSDGQKTLFITFGMEFRRTHTILAVDLSAIEAIGFRIDKLVVNITCTMSKREKIIERFRRLVGIEIERLGCVLIGQPSISAIVPTPYASVHGGERWTFEVHRA